MSLLGSAKLCGVCRKRMLAVALGRQSVAVAGPSRLPEYQAMRSSRIPRLSISARSPASRPFSSTGAVTSAKSNDLPLTKKRTVDMMEFPPERIRNLSIIAHIDHGKSTLADRLLQMTGTVPASSSPQFLDKLKVERERGITVKAQTVSIIHTHTDGNKYLINLIDTPGHVDFSYEVSRSLGACEGGLLLVDCTQGIQAQTLSVFHVAQEANLTLLPVINKVDLPHASPTDTSEQIELTLGLTKEKHMRISAKSGLGVEEVLNQIVEGLPSPKKWEQDDAKLRGLVFDTFYDHFRGVVSLVRLFSGTIKKGDKIRFLQSDRKYDVLEVGIHNPEEVPVDVLKDGQVGYVVCNMKNSEEAFIGDTICHADKLTEPLPGFKPMKAMVYAGVFPIDGGEFNKLEEAIERLTLNDRSVSVQRESSAALSQGFRLGFLGTLHMDVFRQRLEDEYDSNVIVTAPTVPYKLHYHGNKTEYISNPAEFPDVTNPKSRVIRVEEPMVNATIFVPQDYIGGMMDLCSRYRGVQQEYRVLEATDRAILRYSFPLSEIVTDFFSELKSSSSGFASFDYEEAGYETSDLVKLNMMLNSKPVDALAMIVHRSAAVNIGRVWTKKLKDVLPRQLFEVAIQAAIGSRVVARETLSAVRKDVTAGLYGGHYERKLKHLNKQKEGKKRLKRLAGNIDIPQAAFFDVLSSRPRLFSTSTRQYHSSARTLHTDTNGVSPAAFSIMQALPADLPSASLPSSHGSRPAPPPISRHTISPLERSEQLSEFRQLVASPESTSEDIHAAFVKLYLNSPYTHVYTASELQEAVQAMLKRESRNEPGKRLRLNRLVKGVLDELKAVSGDTGAAQKLDIAVKSLAIESIRRHNVTTLEKSERAFEALWKVSQVISDGPPTSHRAYIRGINKLLHMAATAGESAKFDKWWIRLQDAGIEPESDGQACLAKLILLDRTGHHSQVAPTLLAALDKVELVEEKMILVNHAIWSHTKSGEWAIIAPVLEAVLPAGNTIQLPGRPFPFSHKATASSPFATFAESQPDLKSQATSSTYSTLLHVLSYQAYLEPALQTLQAMLQAGFRPAISDYAHIFLGFARHGVIPPNSRAGIMASAFPMWSKFERPVPPSQTPYPGSTSPTSDRTAGYDSTAAGVAGAFGASASGFSRLSQSAYGLWAGRGEHSRSASRYEEEARSDEAQWNYETLQYVFETFMEIKPIKRKSSISSRLLSVEEIEAMNQSPSTPLVTSLGPESSSTSDLGSSQSTSSSTPIREMDDSKREEPHDSASLKQIIFNARQRQLSLQRMQTLQQDAQGDRAPTPKALWHIMMAFARTTNGDEDVLKYVWGRLEREFSDRDDDFGNAYPQTAVPSDPGHMDLDVDMGVAKQQVNSANSEVRNGNANANANANANEEGWKGWRLDGRLMRLREQMQNVGVGQGETEQGDFGRVLKPVPRTGRQAGFEYY